jgi:hypothetical protein
MKPISDETLLCNSIYLEFEICDLCSNKNNIFHEEREYETTQGILQEYRHADLKRRCDIWLMFPALREAFDDIG